MGRRILKSRVRALCAFTCAFVLAAAAAADIPAETKKETGQDTKNGADTETAVEWEATFADVVLSGNYSADILQIAQTQLGYKESKTNYVYSGEADSDGAPAFLDEEKESEGEVLPSNASSGVKAADAAGSGGGGDAGSLDRTEGSSAEDEKSPTDDDGSGDTPDDAGDDTGGTGSEETGDTDGAGSGENSGKNTAGSDAPSGSDALSGSASDSTDAAGSSADTGGNGAGSTQSIAESSQDGSVSVEDITAVPDESGSVVVEGTITENGESEAEAEDDALADTPSEDKDSVKKGYTRYGDWFGIPYGDWCAMFVSFCLNYADVPAAVIPRNASCADWISTLQGSAYGLYTSAGSSKSVKGTPKPGDLVFFDWNHDGHSDHVGIVAALSASAAADLDKSEREAALSESIEALIADTSGESFDNVSNCVSIVTVEGNSSDKVQTKAYSLSSSYIMGYGRVPEYTYDGLKNALSELLKIIKDYGNIASEGELADLCEFAGGRAAYAAEAAFCLYYDEEITSEQCTELKEMTDEIFALLEEYGYVSDKISISGTVSWDDEDDADGMRPEGIEVYLYADGELKSTIAVKTDAQIYSFENLSRYEGGEEVTYSIGEYAQVGYTADYSEDGLNVTNTHRHETVSLQGIVDSEEAYDSLAVRLDSIEIYLYADGELKSIEKAGADGFYSFYDLPKYEDNRRVIYSIGEHIC